MIIIIAGLLQCRVVDWIVLIEVTLLNNISQNWLQFLFAARSNLYIPWRYLAWYKLLINFMIKWIFPAYASKRLQWIECHSLSSAACVISYSGPPTAFNRSPNATIIPSSTVLPASCPNCCKTVIVTREGRMCAICQPRSAIGRSLVCVVIDWSRNSRLMTFTSSKSNTAALHKK